MTTDTSNAPRNVIFNADCIDVMRSFDRGLVDMIVTDPPYITRYRSRDGRTVANDDNARWLHPAFNQMHRVLKDGGFCVSFYGWNKIDLLFDAWKEAGFRVVGHIVFRKGYASSERFLRYEHEQAYLLAKGEPTLPAHPVPDVLDFPYTGNKLHPTQKPVEALMPLIEAFTQPGDLVLDPFCGSGSTLDAAQRLGRDWTGIELNNGHYHTARRRLDRQAGRAAA
ncbi:DNA methylase [Sphingomonas paucimobilis]|uniref:DNA methyltransferase n=1 Tax=Sphingomonas paucimobilis TaxID=13689 RepID=UPI000DE4F8CB|nr:DNA methyltransferase [Sphingomonas paucimobilis]QBE92498.1 DNA methylase [Sphingomonas paucimobilis]